MKEKIVILNVLTYEDKNSKEPRTRLSFIFQDEKYFIDSTNLKGRSEIACYYNNGDVFKKVPSGVIGKPINATLETRVSPYNPMRSTQIIKAIEVNGAMVNLI